MNKNSHLPAIVHSVREIGPGGGVSGVAFALDAAFRQAGLQSEAFTLKNLGLGRSRASTTSLVRKRLRLMLDVVAYSTVGSIVGAIATRGKLVISHNDGLFGEVYVNHGLHKAMLKQSGRGSAMALRNPLHLFLLVREWLRFKLRLHRCIVCFAESEAKLLQEYYPGTAGRTVIIPNGVNVGRFRPDPELRAAGRRQWSLGPEDFVVSFVGHEFDRKGLYPLVRALALLPASVRLLVAGGTAEEIARGRAAAQAAGVEPRVIFAGVCREVERLLNASDVFALPSRFEAWPLVGLEALACGLPALLKPTGGIPDFLADGKNGFFITDEPGDIAAKIRWVLEHPLERAAMAREARATALRFSWEAVAQKYIHVLTELHAPPRAIVAGRQEQKAGA